MRKELLKRFLAGFMVFTLTFMSVDSGCITAIAADLQVNQPEVVTNESVNYENFQGATGYIDIGHVAGRVDDSQILGGIGLNQSIDIPESYSSVDLGYVTSIKNQGRWGTCWAFAACAAMESYALKKGYATDKTAIDFSEYALVYLTYRDEILRSQTGDYTYAKAEDMTTLFNSGGNSEYAFRLLSQGLGIYNEGTDTYYADSLNSEIGIVEYVPNEEKMDYILTGQKYINMNDTAHVKAAIMENGALAVSYYAADAYEADAYGKYNYNYSVSGTNHGVALVGWDDTIDKNLFEIDGHVPENNGAWLVKNSWGTGTNYDGYIWISYEDLGILSSDAVVYEVTPKEEIDNIYQHDSATPFAGYRTGFLFATVFEVEGMTNQLLEAVSFALHSTDSNYTISIYRTTEDNTFYDGELLATVTGSTSYEGYYTVELDTPVGVTAGDEITIIIRFDDTEEIVTGLNNWSMIGEYDGKILTYSYSTVYSSSQAGEDFLGYGTENNPYFQDLVGTEEEKNHNLCVKAFTSDVIIPVPEDVVVEGIETEVNYNPDNAIEFENVVVKLEGVTLTAGTDYDISYENNNKAGTATCVITFKGNYSGTIRKDFTIKPLALENDTIAFVDANGNPVDKYTYTYTGSAIIPSVIIKSGELKSGENGALEFDIEFAQDVDHTNAGTVEFTVVLNGNYSGSVTGTLEILPINVADNDDLLNIENIPGQEYTGNSIIPALTITYNEQSLIKDVDYTVAVADDSESNGTNLGTVTLQITFIGNYSGEESVDFEIVSNVLTSEEVAIEGIDAEIDYDPYDEIEFENVVVKLEGVELVAGTDYDITYENNNKVGTATCVITFKGNYSGTIRKEFTIKPLALDEELIIFLDEEGNPVDKYSYTYTGSAIIPDVIIMCGELDSGEDSALEFDIEFAQGVDHTNAGTIQFTVVLKGNYSGSVTGTLVILPISVNDNEELLTIGSIPEQEYTGSAIVPSGEDVVVMYNNIILTENTDYQLSVAEGVDNVHVGTSELTITFIGNYEGLAKKNFKIKEKEPEDITSTDIDINPDTGYISKITAGTTVAAFREMLKENVTVHILDKENKTVANNALLGTGMKVQVMNGTEVVKTYTVIVTGDTNGDGKITITDMIAIKAHILKKELLTGASEKAADVAGAADGGDGKATITDFIKVKAHVLKKETIKGVVVK